MITVKITPVGGYICGDGPIPGNLQPDQFYKMFMQRIIEAKQRGLEELILTDNEIEEEMKNQMIVDSRSASQEHYDTVARMVDETSAREYVDNIEMQQLLEHIV